MQVTYHCGTLCNLKKATARKCKYSCTSQVKKISIISSKIPMMAALAQVWDSVSSKAIPFLDQTQCNAQHRRHHCTLIPYIKVCSTHYRVCGSVTRNKALINWSSMKMAHYPQKLLASLKQSRDTNVEFGEDRLFVKPGKTLGVGRRQMEF